MRFFPFLFVLSLEILEFCFSFPSQSPAILSLSIRSQNLNWFNVEWIVHNYFIYSYIYFVSKILTATICLLFFIFIFWLSRSEWKWLCDESIEPLLIFEYSQALLAILHKLWNSNHDILMKVTTCHVSLKNKHKMGSCWDFSCFSH